jgi:hypothetical protein
LEDTINDCFVDVIGVVPSQTQIKNIAEQLPSSIKNLAAEWGWNDTEVGNKVFRWIEKEKAILSEK